MKRMDNRQAPIDVFVMGAGLAGITAAIWAAREGASVCLASSGPVCSGSSFYPGTWGLGLVGPEGKADEEDLRNTILTVGEGMADPKLAQTLVSGISQGIQDLEAMGVRLKEAVHKGEKEFIPCFDHKGRDWHGIIKESAREAFLRELEALSVIQLSRTTVTDLWKEGEGFYVGAVRKGEKGWEFCSFHPKAVVIASGGLGGLFSRRLNTDDATGLGQYLALEAGASLVNLEFMQMMPGFIKPAPKTIYNEKVFACSNFSDRRTGQSIFGGWSKEEEQERMKIRSTHGPFTCRLGSGPVDIRLFEQCLKDEGGVRLTYKDELRKSQPEFVQTYFQWLKEEKGLTIDDPVDIGIFAHASNGGIRIDSRGGCGVPGLFACGECTGGMHGADRIGGLSTANGLVFGKLAGIAAAGYSRCRKKELMERAGENRADSWGRSRIPGAFRLLEQLRQVNYQAGMVVRREKELCAALKQVEELKKTAVESKEWFPGRDVVRAEGEGAAAEYCGSRILEGALTLSEGMLKAMLMRRESRGSHYREDFPKKEESFGCPILITEHQGTITVNFNRERW